MFFSGLFYHGRYQAPRPTLRHYPLAPAVFTAAAVGAAAFFMPSHVPTPIVRAAQAPVLVRGSVVNQSRLRIALRTAGHTAATVSSQAAMNAARRRLAARQRIVLTGQTLPASYRVRHGDTLSSVAKRFYGKASLWPALWWVNRAKVSNPAVLLVGDTLALSPWHPRKAWLKRQALAAIPTPTPSPAAPAGAPSPPGSQPVPAPQTGSSLQAYAAQLFGSQYGCAAAIIARESGWQVTIANPGSGAYGIPQALPGSKMASAGADWATNGDTQLRWMKGYVDSVYGGACAAWAHWQAAGSY